MEANNNLTQRGKHLLPYVFLISTILQIMAGMVVLIVYGKNGFYAPDTYSYIEPAMGLLSSGTFAANGQIEIFRTPGYPLFLAPFLYFKNWEILVVIAQCILGGIIAMVTYILTAEIWNEKAGIIATALFTLSPLTLEFSSMLLTERLSSFFIAIICISIFSFMRTKSYRTLVFIAILTACSIFVRPAALFMPYGIALFILGWGVLARIGFKKTIAFTLLFLLCSLAPIKAWTIRNNTLTGYKGFTSVSAVNMYFYNAASILAKLEGTSFHAMQEKLGYGEMNRYLDQHVESQNLPAGEVFNRIEKEGKAIIKNNLYPYSKIHLLGMGFTLIIPGTADYVRKGWGETQPGFRKMKEGKSLGGFILSLIKAMPVTFFILASSAILLLVCHILSLIGIFKSLPIHPAPVLFLAGVISYFILISGGPAGYSRFRDPIGFIFAIFAGIGLEWLLGKKASRRVIDHE